MQEPSKAPIDNSLGIAWRLGNQIRRFSLRRSLRIALGLLRPPRHERPVFILGAPRSGTTLLFRVLGLCPELGHLPREGHIMWRAFHHPRYSGWRSDAIPAGQVRRGERRFISAYLGAFFVQRRFVEKTPENTLRIPYLLDLFPDAHFVVIQRNPCDVINSLINGWRDPEGRYRSYYVPKDLSISGHGQRRQWRFALVEGWRELASASIPQIALEQWRQCVQGIRAGRQLVPAERWSELQLETLLLNPARELRQLLAKLGVEADADLIEQQSKLLLQPINALTPVRQEKWRQENPTEIEALLPSLAELAELSGYQIDLKSGSCSPLIRQRD